MKKQNRLQQVLNTIALPFRSLKNIVLRANALSTLVSGQFKKTDVTTKTIDNPYFDLRLHRLRMGGSFIDIGSENHKNQIMTYIVCGKINHKPFLMVDCVATKKINDVKTYHYTDKLSRLISSTEESYYCLTGKDAFEYAINAFDRKCFQNDINFDFKNIEHINEILELYKIIIKKPEYNGGQDIMGEFIYCKIYFITRTDVYYYLITKDCSDNLILSEIKEVENNKIVNGFEPENIQNPDASNEEQIEICKKLIRCSSSQGYGIDLKDRFSSIMFDGNKKIYIDPSRNNNELVMTLIRGKYEELD